MEENIKYTRGRLERKCIERCSAKMLKKKNVKEYIEKKHKNKTIES